MLYKTYDSRSLARRIADSGEPDRLSRHRGVVQSINTDGTVNLTLDGSTVTLTSIPRLRQARVNTGDTIEAIIDENDIFILGRLADEDENGIVLDNSGDMIRFEGSTGPMGIQWQGDAAEGDWELQLVYRTTPNTLGIEDAVGSPIIEWDTSNKLTRMYGDVTIESDVAQINFIETDMPENFFFHVNNGKFFLLADRDGDGNWETPYPFRVDMSTGQYEFWVGSGGFTSYIDDTGIFRINIIHANFGDAANPTYTFSGTDNSGMYLSGGVTQITTGGLRVLHLGNSQVVGISADQEKNLGNASNRWKAVYATDGTINTSDASEKQDIVDSDLGLEFIKALRPRRHRWNNGTRPHYNLIAQEVKQVIDNIGVDFAGFIDPSVDWEYNEDDPDISGETPGPLSLRYHEFISPMIKAIQELDTRLSAIETQSPSRP